MPNRIGLFGGTFDPPHLGHLILASEAQTQLELDRLLWILTPEPPHKQDQFITAIDHRLAMVKLAAELNAAAFGSVPTNGSFAAWESAYCGTSQTAISNAMSQAAAFNNSGDTQQFTPGTSADSKNARAIANYVWWNTLP